MINPYEGVNWSVCQQIQSISHLHSDISLVEMYDSGLRHLPISNYYPSVPYYPLSNFFETIPDGVIGSPNAEHHNSFVDGEESWAFHFNSLGSTWSSGKPKGEDPVGVQDTWQNAFKNIFDNLIYKDGGGVTINHPSYTQLSLRDAKRFLDYDERVLGIEIFNGPATDPNAWDLEMWDELLKTGRRVWGFCVVDHPTRTVPIEGRSVLLVDNFTEEECLKAYREGHFYGRINNTDLKFTELSCSGNVLTAKTNNATSMKVIVDGNEQVFNATEVTYTVPNNAVYVRVEAHTDSDSIFSNPFIFKPFKKRRSANKLMWY